MINRLIKLLFIINIFNKQIKPKTSSILLLQMSVLPVVLKARTLHTATMIFLHGLGDTGHGWAGILNTIRPDYMKIVCPTAPSIPVSLNNGMVMPAWYDIKDISSDNSAIREDIQGVEASTKVLQTLIDMEALALKDAGRSRIMIGGFSQGGAIALNTLLRSNDKGKLAGCAALSTYIPGTYLHKVRRQLETTYLCYEIDCIDPSAFRKHQIRNSWLDLHA